jgi:predicted ATPase
MKVLVIAVMALALAACNSTGKYAKIEKEKYERDAKHAEKALDKMPDWMTEVPEDSSAVYANGTATSYDINMADTKAMTMAMGKICISAGGTVDERSRVFMQDTPDGTIERSELAIQSMCDSVDVSGAEIAKIKRITQGTKYRTYVLMVLPFGDANQLAAIRRIARDQAQAQERMEEVFEEMESN